MNLLLSIPDPTMRNLLIGDALWVVASMLGGALWALTIGRLSR